MVEICANVVYLHPKIAFLSLSWEMLQDGDVKL